MTADGLTSVQPQFVGNLGVYLAEAPLFLPVAILKVMKILAPSPVHDVISRISAFGCYFDFWFYGPQRRASGVRMAHA